MDPRTSRLDPAGSEYHAVTRHGSAHTRRMTRAEIVADAAQEALERSDRLEAAKSTGTVVRTVDMATPKAAIDPREVRLHCFNCAVMEASHAEFGCKRWRAA
jgi:hypothetical protein